MTRALFVYTSIQLTRAASTAVGASARTASPYTVTISRRAGLFSFATVDHRPAEGVLI
jgi:hypothetical protein